MTDIYGIKSCTLPDLNEIETVSTYTQTHIKLMLQELSLHGLNG